ncbi:MAG: major facilitator family transporter [Holophagaceae bacterium]|nr:major facilitator family transporter [Holophagaceae bacterium]
MSGSKVQSRAWVVLWTAAAVQFLGGLLYIWSVISKALTAPGSGFGWTTKQASLPYTTATVCFVIAMVIMGRVQDAKGPRFCGTLAGCFTGFGLILSGLVHTPLMMTLTFGVLVGAGSGSINVATTPAALKWFPSAKKGTITGIVVAFIALASILYAPLITWLLGAYGVSKSLIILGVVLLVLMVGCAQFLANPPAEYNPNEGAEVAQSKVVSSGVDTDWKGMLKSFDFYKLWFMFAFSSSAGLMVIGHAAKIAKIQVQWEKGFLLLIFLAIFNAGGRFLGGSLSDKIGRVNLMRIIFVVQALNMLFFKNFLSIPLLALGVALAGLCYGASFSVFPAATADKYGMKNFGANYGVIFTAWGLGGIIGPMTAAAIVDSTKSYNMAYLVSCALLVVALLISFTLKTAKPAKA